MDDLSDLIQPVILAGGTGTRLWPSSRSSLPKQFANLLPGKTLYQSALRWLSGPQFAAPLVLTSETSRFLAAEQSASVGITCSQIVLEPTPRNTGPAVLTAGLLMADHPERILLIAPSDHLIQDTHAFHRAVCAALRAAQQGALVTFGVAPDRPETGYGYLELADPKSKQDIFDLHSFVEKPSATEAERMAASDRYLWNAGIYLFRVSDILAAYDCFAPQMVATCRAAVAQARQDLGFLRLAPCYSDAPCISIDHAVMEKTDLLKTVRLSAGWSDLGSWNSIHQALPEDANGVAEIGPVTALDCRQSLLRSDDDTVHLVGLGLNNIAAIATRDAVLVADLGRAQDIRQVTAALTANGVQQAHKHPRHHRPWGWYESLCTGDRFQVKRIMVKPGGILSLQSHMHRAEHWVVVAGTARVTVGNEIRLLSENESLYVPLGAVHRLENPGKLPVYLIEVQTGAYLDEDDITRHADAYNRDAAE